MASNYSEKISSFSRFSDDFGLMPCELSFKILKPLDEVLRCRICDEYFKNCMITKCSHNYCSICIRRYMMHKSQCPICFQDAFEPDLRNNRLIDEVLRAYIKIRETLESATAQEDKKTIDLSDATFTPVKIEVEKDTHKGDERPERGPKDEEDTDSNDVACPVCYKLVLKDRINIHLDVCLKQQEKERTSERKTLPKVVYHLLSDKEIKKRLKEHGLSTSGDRQVLVKRHKNFVVLFNANCDSLDPKSVEDLVQEIEIQELEEQINAFPKQIHVHKKSDISEIETEHESYVKRHQSQFNALINDVQQRHMSQVTVKQECHSSQEDSHANSIMDQFGNVIGESTFSSGKTTESRTCKPQESSHVDKETQKKICEGKDPKSCFTKHIKQPNVTIKSESRDKNQDLLIDDETPPSSPDLEIGKITQLNLLRKRKKRTVTVDNSPKKK